MEEDPEARVEDLGAAVLQSVVLRRDALGQAQLERGAWGTGFTHTHTQLTMHGGQANTDKWSACVRVCVCHGVSMVLCVPEALAEGVVHAELWQRPAEICRMFFP